MGKSHTRALEIQARRLITLSIVFLIASLSFFSDQSIVAQDQVADPTAWGSDHVGHPIPMYMTGDECLFCHREEGATWQANRHNVGMRIIDLVTDDVAALLKSPAASGFGPETTYVLGGIETLRFLKPNEKYGQFAIHSAHADPKANLKLTPGANAWDNEIFAAKCAGCHTTAVETEIKGFAAPSLDCYVCHGDVPPGHQNEPTMAILAKKRAAEPLVDESLCAQCHLRGGKSKTSGLPYPNQFVPGDNLFKDFEADLSDAAIAAMNPGDAHVFANVRDVVIAGKLEMTCVTCHDIHGNSSRKHRVLPKNQRLEYCAICHQDPADFKQFKVYERHSATCEY